MMPEAVTFFGSLTIDDLVFADGSTRWAVPGGNAAYSALGASIWASNVRIVAPLGSDYPWEILHGKVDLARCRRQVHSLRNWGLYEQDGSRHFISRSSSRNWPHFAPGPVMRDLVYRLERTLQRSTQPDRWAHQRAESCRHIHYFLGFG